MEKLRWLKTLWKWIKRANNLFSSDASVSDKELERIINHPKFKETVSNVWENVRNQYPEIDETLKWFEINPQAIDDWIQKDKTAREFANVVTGGMVSVEEKPKTRNWRDTHLFGKVRFENGKIIAEDSENVTTVDDFVNMIVESLQSVENQGLWNSLVDAAIEVYNSPGGQKVAKTLTTAPSRSQMYDDTKRFTGIDKTSKAPRMSINEMKNLGRRNASKPSFHAGITSYKPTTAEAVKTAVNKIQEGIYTVAKNTYSKTRPSNNPAWYTKYAALNAAGSGINFLQPTGVPVRPWYLSSTVSMPRVAGIKIYLTSGSEDNSISFSEWYTVIRAANSGNRNYNANDLSKYCFNYRGLLAIYSLARKAYALLREYSCTDYTVPAAYFAAMGLDFDTFRENSSNFRNWINNFALTLQTFAPRKISLFERTLSLFDNIYKDGPEAKAQEYVFTLEDAGMVYYNYNSNTFVVNSLTATGVSATLTGVDYATFIASADAQLKNFVAHADNPVIAGDMLKTWGENGVIHLDLVTEDYRAPHLYDEEILMQIQNAVLVGYGAGTSFTHSLDANGFVICKGKDNTWPLDPNYYTGVANDPFDVVVVNLPSDKTDSAMRFVATRFSTVTKPQSGGIGVDFISFGTEVVGHISIVAKVAGVAAIYELSLFNLTEPAVQFDATAITPGGMYTYQMKLAMISCFDWMPRFYPQIIWNDSGTTKWDTRSPIYDWKQFGIADAESFKYIEIAVERSLYSIMDVSTVNKSLDAAPAVFLKNKQSKYRK